MSLAAALARRWDLDATTRAELPFDRIPILITLRRMEIACALLLVNDVIGLWRGIDVPAILIRIPFVMLWMPASRYVARWRNPDAQKAAALLVIILLLADSIWASIDLSSRSGRLNDGYPYSLLSAVMLAVLPPRTWAWIIGVTYTAFSVAVLLAPLPAENQVSGISSAGVIAIICQVAGWLIYAARRADHEQKRIIRLQNLELAERNRELDQLMAITAHDLRSPLFGVRNLLDLAARRADPAIGATVGAMRDAVRGIDAMIALVSKLLDAHSAEYEPLTVIANGDVRDHVAAAVRRILPTAKAKGVAVELGFPDEPLLAAMNAVALGRVLDNLLDNAVRLSPQGSRVWVACTPRVGAVVIEVRDEGPGFDAAGEAAMFAKFHHRDTVRGGSGHGMGLFIAATFAKRMGAELSYRPAEPTGARFLIELVAS